ncbi:oxygenase MpaB family protein [Mycolicibacterium moriokaense]|uniref:Uncharacterized protein (DUF2236 family) n=1 Tax=Mycolicibacterium moriokaense TaxID=39691 RepID=A0A318H853_9MYCO|nr:oxygenase MpaB family protein [Mycolicibacterium moriokaense]PXW96093.1 uncharacterized protein (DUF2236 family) [Mycolicibacterium moriokaense]
MTCPVAHRPSGTDSAEAGISAAPTASASCDSADVADRFEEVAGSVFVGLFAAGLFDQAMLPPVSAALDDTGRIRDAPWGRALRTAASDQIIFHADEADRRAETKRLVRLHRDVKGVGADGVRYSALNPESWNWILISTFFVYRNAFVAITGEKPSATANQAIWDRFRQLSDGLQLSGSSRLIENYDELCTYYDQMVAEKLEVTSTLKCAVRYTRRPSPPAFIPAPVAPVWNLTSPMIGHVLGVLGFGIMHPDVRALVPMTWTRRHDREFAVLAMAIRLAYQWLPTRVTDTPLARNRREYQRLMARYQGIGLTSFAPTPTRP